MEGHLRILGLGEFERSLVVDVLLVGCVIKGSRPHIDVEVGHIWPCLHVQKMSLLMGIKSMIILWRVLKAIIDSGVSNCLEVIYSITNILSLTPAFPRRVHPC